MIGAQSDGRMIEGGVVRIAGIEMLPQRDEFTFRETRRRQDWPLAMPARHEDRHAPSTIRSTLRPDDPGMESFAGALPRPGSMIYEAQETEADVRPDSTLP